MATSEFARKTAKAFADKTVEMLGAVPIIEVGAAALTIDAELQEVREVLHGLRGRYVKDCWCGAGDDAEHYATCLRARALWAKLQIGET